MKKINILFAVLLILPFWAMGQMQWQRLTGGRGQTIPDLRCHEITLDGGGATGVQVTPFNGTYLFAVEKINAQGGLQWRDTVQGTAMVGLRQLPTDSSIVLCYWNTWTSLRLSRWTRQGVLIQDTAFVMANRTTSISMVLAKTQQMLLNSNGKLVLLVKQNDRPTLVQMNFQGTEDWARPLPSALIPGEEPMSLEASPMGGYYIMTRVLPPGGGRVYHNIYHTDASGRVLWKRDYTKYSIPADHYLKATPDGGCVAIVDDSALIASNAHSTMLVKIDQQGQEEWRQSLGHSLGAGFNNGVKGLLVDASGTYKLLYTGGTNFSIAQRSTQGLLIGRTDYYNLLSNSNPWVVTFERSGSGYRMLYATNGFVDDIVLQTGAGNAIYSNIITGYVYDDANNNCQYDATEAPWAYQLIVARGTQGDFYGTTDAQGQYQMVAGTGSYEVSLARNLPYRMACPVLDTVNFALSSTQDSVDFGIQVVDSCAFMEVHLSAPYLRRCFASQYHVSYSNRGTQTTDSAYVTITLDTFLTYLSSSIPLSSQVGNTLRFDLGQVGPLGGGQFTMQVQVDCDSTVLGQSHCTEAHIYPDTLCGNLWAGPIIQVSSICRNDSVFFRLYNAGASMSQPHQYVVIEEHVMILQAQFSLAANTHTWVGVPSTAGKVYRMEADQMTGYPAVLGDPIAIENRLGCNSGVLSVFTPNILNQFYQGNSSPFVAVDCQDNIGSYDPNDKHAQPVGYGPQHYIEKNTPIDYRIRFQNTGTDTAFTVVIVDTLDTDLDPATISLGASSYPYTWSLDGQGILTVRFDNIYLPDSNVNEPASHGFIKFKIHQDPNLPDGTRLTNQAAIYFDFNAPIITNEVFHTIGSNFMEVRVVGIDQPLLEGIELQLYPNPFSHQATLEVRGATYDRLEVEVYNSMGQRLHIYQGSGSQLTLERQGLPSGVYLYRLIGDGQLLNTGKMILR